MNNNNNGNNGNNANNNNSNNNGGGAAAGAGGKKARRKNSTMRNTIRKQMKNPKTMSLGLSSKNKTLKAKKAAQQKLLAQGRDPKEIVYKKINNYRKEAQVIYDDHIASIEKAKQLIAIIDKLYYRMPTAELKGVVEVEIDVNGLAENILEAYNKILTKLEEKTKTANARAVDELALLLGGIAF